MMFCLRTYELEVKVNIEEITAQPFPLTLVNGMYTYHMYTIFSQVTPHVQLPPLHPQVFTMAYENIPITPKK